MKDSSKTKERLIHELEEMRTKVVKLEKKKQHHKKLEEKLREVSIRDDLTGLLNRRGFFTIAEKQCEIANRNDLNLSFLFIDIDKMKAINDEFGHKTGDEALIDSANILKNSFRSSDIITRIGGDEFVVIVMETPETKVETLTNRLKANLRSHNLKANKPYTLSLSMGLTQYTHENPCSVDELITLADKLMYEQKKERNL
jgi:diguanylate cyclase (GGDEF)-like protein